MKRDGFTLIEMTLSIGLGVMIIYVALAGMRVLAQSITQANKMALENSVMRAGVQISLDFVDFWTDRDNPTSTIPKDQLLRGTADDKSNPRIRRGSIFTPFTVTSTATDFGAAPATPTSVQVVAAGLNESTRGWDSNAWHAAASRTWPLTNMVEAGGNNSFFEQLHGRYYLLSAPVEFNPAPAHAAANNFIRAPNHPWHARQARGLLLSLGQYGMMDYLPPNFPRIIYVPTPTKPNTPWDPNSIKAPWAMPGNVEWMGGIGGAFGEYAFGSQYGNPHSNFGLYGLTATCAMAVPNRQIAPSNLSHLSNRSYHVVVSGLGTWQLHNLFAAQGFAEMQKDGEETDYVLRDGSDPLLPLNKPMHWPSMEVKCVRFLREGVFTNLQRVIMTDSLTGKSTQISFTCFGTTLRGARQQRAKGTGGTASGWVDPFSFATPVTLDSP